MTTKKNKSSKAMDNTVEMEIIDFTAVEKKQAIENIIAYYEALLDNKDAEIKRLTELLPNDDLCESVTTVKEININVIKETKPSLWTRFKNFFKRK